MSGASVEVAAATAAGNWLDGFVTMLSQSGRQAKVAAQQVNLARLFD